MVEMGASSNVNVYVNVYTITPACPLVNHLGMANLWSALGVRRKQTALPLGSLTRRYGTLMGYFPYSNVASSRAR